MNTLNQPQFIERYTDDYMVFVSENKQNRLACYYSEYLECFVINSLVDGFSKTYYRISYQNFQDKLQSLIQLNNLK